MIERLTKSSGCGTQIAVGCAVMLVLGLVGAYLAYRAFRARALPMMAAGMTKAVEGMLKESDLTDDEKEQVRRSVGRVTDRLAAGELSGPQCVKLVEALTQGPLLHLMMVKSFHKQQVEQSGLSEEEKAQAKRSTDRFLRGIAEEKIPPEASQSVAQSVPKEQGPGRQEQWKEKLTDDEVRKVVATVKKAADDAAVPDEPYEVDLVKEIDKVVDAALAEATAAE